MAKSYISLMKIVTWNIERLPFSKKENITAVLAKFDADIIILTETKEVLDYGRNMHKTSTILLPNFYDGQQYSAGENRVTLLSKYPIAKTYVTKDAYTSICADVLTPIGPLRIYGTITGVFGGIGNRFISDLEGQLEDFDSLLAGSNCCIAGDLNTFFSGYAYPSHKARNVFNYSFQKLNLKNLTADLKDNVDHIIISESFIKDRKIKISIFNEDKSLSDHIGICAEIL